MYDKYPLLCNTVAGSAVYSAGEFIVQHHARSQDKEGKATIDYSKIRQLGLLGGLENGFFMSVWYNVLNYCVGSSRATSVVLMKCALDQAFFATQQDAVFLAVCAIQHQNALPDAVRCVKRDFLTTWVNDCSVWPLVNFVGFAVVPVKIQPTFMSTVQLFWQVYISSVAAASSGSSPTNAAEGGRREDRDSELEVAFGSMDLDGNGFLDADEMRQALQSRGARVTKAEVEGMISEVHKLSGGSAGGKAGQVSLAEFKAVMRLRTASSHAQLWERLKTSATLEKGAKKLMRRIADQKREAGAAGPGPLEPRPDRLELRDDPVAFVAKSWSTICAIMLEEPPADKAAYGEAWVQNRESAVHNSIIGGSALALVSVVRRLVFKI